MSLKRRQLLELAAASVATSVVPARALSQTAEEAAIRAIAFDAFPIFDPRPVFALTETLFPGKGAELSNVWRTRQFEYQWLRALIGRYADFWQVTEEALVFSAAMLKLELTPDKRKQLMQAYLELKTWPDAAPALQTLKSSGLRLAFLSNATPAILEAGIRNARLEGLFEHVLSTDARRTYKPDPRAYRMGLEAFGLRREEILFVAFGGWDAAGAKAFGYPTFWVNRLKLPVEELGVAPDAIGSTLTDVVSFLKA